MDAYQVSENLRLWVPRLPPSYQGRLYFVLRQGLGDTVNGLRILHEVMKRYPGAEPIVYADPRWKDLYALLSELSGRAIRFYPEGRSPVSQGRGAIEPYRQAYREIREEAGRFQSHVALGDLKLADQWSKKETNIDRWARAIGLALDSRERRPYLPVPKSALEGARQFLVLQGLKPGEYFAFAPYTWPDKLWTADSWERLMAELSQTTGFPALLIGEPGHDSIKGDTIKEALGLPLAVVAGLIAQSCCYIGLDTGPTHMAACFDVPLVTLNPQGKFPPFLIEPSSPLRWTHLTPGVYGARPITVASVFETVRAAMDRPTPPRCLSCDALPYVLDAEQGKILFLCRCGLLFTQEFGLEGSGLCGAPDLNSTIGFPPTRAGLSALRSVLTNRGRDGKREAKTPARSFFLEHWDPIEEDPIREAGRELWWNWDSACQFLKRCGWQILESRVSPPEFTKGKRFSISIAARAGEEDGRGPLLQFPWGRKILSARRQAVGRWLSWGIFRRQEDLEEIGSLVLREGRLKEGYAIWMLALRARPRWRMIGKLFKGSVHAAWSKWRVTPGPC